MSEFFRLWLLGVFMHWFFALVLYGIGVLINPIHHFSLLETWAIVMIFIVINYGIKIIKDEEAPIH